MGSGRSNRRRVAGVLLGAGLGAVAPVPAVAAAPAVAPADAPTPSAAAGPTPAQIRTAIRAAERSPKLWATINTCGQGRVGFRGQIPALAFASRPEMSVQPKVWSATAHRYVDSGHADRIAGRTVTGPGTVQAGITLTYATPQTLIGSITFRWIRDGRTLGSLTRATSGGHPDDRGTPTGTSLAQCSIA